MKPVYIENLLNLPIENRANYLLNSCTEGQWFDRKGIKIDLKDIVKSIIAFANAEGGAIAFGASNGVVAGIRNRKGIENDLPQAIYDYTRPPIKVMIDKVDIIATDGKKDQILFLTIPPSDMVHEDQCGKCFLRIGDETRELRHSDRLELEYNKGVRQYDGEIIKGSNTKDLDISLVERYARNIGAKSENYVDTLKARFLVDKYNRQTNACHLLFSQHPQDIFPQASIRITKFLSDERGTGSTLNIDANHDHRLDGNIPTLLRKSIEIVSKLVYKKKSLGPNGEFIFQDIIPHDVWLEGLVNAFIHRSYSMSGDYIHVELYPTRVEIISPGVFPGLARTTDLLKISRFARNPRIARVCTELRFGQELGEGIKRMVSEMRRIGYIDPIYIQTSGNVQLRLEALLRLDEKLLRELPSKSESVLNVVRLHPNGIGTGEIMDLLDMTRPTVSLRLQRLEEKGLIIRHGKSATDPRAVWLIND